MCTSFFLFPLTFAVHRVLNTLDLLNYSWLIYTHSKSRGKTSSTWFPRCSSEGRSEAGFLSRKTSDVEMQAKTHNGPGAVLRPAGERRQRNRWSMIYMPPSTQRETGEVLLSMPRWGSGATGREEGYEVDVWKKEGWMTVIVSKVRLRKRIIKKRGGWINNRGHSSSVCWPSSLGVAEPPSKSPFRKATNNGIKHGEYTIYYSRSR